MTVIRSATAGSAPSDRRRRWWSRFPRPEVIVIRRVGRPRAGDRRGRRPGCHTAAVAVVEEATRYVDGQDDDVSPNESIGLAYPRPGTGDPLVLLHGLGLSRQSWNPVIALLAESFDIIAIDLP